MALYPSEQWLAEYARLLDANAAFGDLSLGWGDGFDGDVVFVIEDLPLSETTLADLPEEALVGLPDGVVESFGDVSLAEAPATFDESVRSSLPDRARDLIRQIEENVVDGAIHAHVGLEEGGCTGTEVLSDPEDHDAGFRISAKYPVWRDLVEGRPPTSAMLTGDLDVSGNQLRQIQYAPLFQVLGKVAADVETEHLFDGAGRRPGDVLLDEAVRQPAFFHRTAQRQVFRTFSMF